MSESVLFDIDLGDIPCLSCLDEDDLRQLVSSLKVVVDQDKVGTLVTSTAGIPIKFSFGADGGFLGAYAKINGASVPLVPGTRDNELTIFKGAPSSSNPPPGWAIESELTKSVLGQDPDQNNWNLFFASRVSVLNSP